MKPNLLFCARGIMVLFFLLFASKPSEARFSIYVKVDSSSFKLLKDRFWRAKQETNLSTQASPFPELPQLYHQ